MPRGKHVLLAVVFGVELLPGHDFGIVPIPNVHGRGIVVFLVLAGVGVFGREVRVRERLKGTLRLDINNPFKRYFFSTPNSVVNFLNPQSFGKITATQGLTSGIGASKFFMEMIFRLEF